MTDEESPQPGADESPLAAAVMALADRIAALETAVSDAPRVYSTWLSSLSNPAFRLLQPIPVVVEEEPGEACVTWPEVVGVAGGGSTLSLAFKALEDDLVSLYEELTCGPSQSLDALELRWLAKLQAVMEQTTPL